MIIMPRIRQRSPIKASNHFSRLIKETLEKKKETKTHKQYIKAIIERDKTKEWPMERSLEEYNACFKPALNKTGLGSDLFDFLKKRYQHTKEPVSVLDLGAGEGNFLADLKKILLGNKIPNKLESLSLVDNISAKNQILIDQKHLISAVDQKLTKKYDLIIDVYSAINYELDSVKKNLILKYAYSLKKGGTLLIAGIYKSPESKRNILAHLRKQGFNAMFVDQTTNIFVNDKKTALVINRK